MDDIDSNENNVSIRKKVIISILGIVLLIVVGITIWQISLPSKVIELYLNKNYKEAYNQKNNLLFPQSLGEYENKVLLMNVLVGYEYENYKKYNSSDSWFYKEMADSSAGSVLVNCVYLSDKSKDYNCYEDVQAIFKEVGQYEANNGVDVEKYLKTVFRYIENPDKWTGQPDKYNAKSKEEEKEIYKKIEDLVNVISKKEAKEIQNEKHPLVLKNTRYTKKYNSDYYIYSGTISNVSKTKHSYVKVKVTYYDTKGEILTTDWSYAVGSEGIYGGENIQFEVSTKVIGNVGKAYIEILEYD